MWSLNASQPFCSSEESPRIEGAQMHRLPQPLARCKGTAAFLVRQMCVTTAQTPASMGVSAQTRDDGSVLGCPACWLKTSLVTGAKDARLEGC